MAPPFLYLRPFLIRSPTSSSSPRKRGSRAIARRFPWVPAYAGTTRGEPSRGAPGDAEPILVAPPLVSGRCDWPCVKRATALRLPSRRPAIRGSAGRGPPPRRSVRPARHRHLIGRGAGQVRIEIDPRIGVEGHHREVVGLVGHAPVKPAVLDDDVGRDMAF